MIFRTDCKHYKGSRPCVHSRLCEGCPHYETIGSRILLIKTAATGDVLRTTSLLPAIKRAFPGSCIEWLTSPYAIPLLERNPHLSGVVPFDAAAYSALSPRDFDLVICLDKELGPAGMATLLRAKEKRGIGLSTHGTPYPLNPEAEHYFALGLSDELKFKQNNKSYHLLIAGALGFDYQDERPELFLSEKELRSGKDSLRLAGWDGASPLVGINTGAGTSFAGKMLSAAQIVEIVDVLSRRVADAHIVLLGGPAESEKNRSIAHAAAGRARDAGCGHSIRGFAAMVAHTGVLLCGDTLAMHIALALGRRSVVMFGPTCEQEIDMFGLGQKIVSDASCAPCYRRECDVSPNCMDRIDLAEIAAAVADELSLQNNI